MDIIEFLKTLPIAVVMSFITWLFTFKYSRRKEAATAGAAEIETIVKKVDAYDKIIRDLNGRVVNYVIETNQLRQENEGLQQKIYDLSSKYDSLKNSYDRLEKQLKNG